MFSKRSQPKNLHLLDQVKVVRQCPASWSHMHGNDQVRHCTHCDRNVFNLSNMTTDEALKVVQQSEGKMCVRFYRRADGMMMTKDCGLGVRALFKTRLLTGSLLSVFGIVITGILTPIYAGTSLSPAAQSRVHEDMIQYYNAQIADEKDPEVKQMLVESRNKERKELLGLLQKHPEVVVVDSH